MGEETTVRAALLARVSTDMQAEEGLSIPAQLAEMREFCEKRGWTVAAEFIDAGYTGSTMDRPGLQGLLAALDQRVFDVVVVHELSRLSRSIFDTFDLFETFGRYDVGFASVKEPNFDLWECPVCRTPISWAKVASPVNRDVCGHLAPIASVLTRMPRCGCWFR